MAVFGTNYEIPFDGSKQGPKWTYLVEKNWKFIKRKKKGLLSVKWMAQIYVLSNVSCWVGRSENLISPSESSWNEDAKLVLDLP